MSGGPRGKYGRTSSGPPGEQFEARAGKGSSSTENDEKNEQEDTGMPRVLTHIFTRGS